MRTERQSSGCMCAKLLAHIASEARKDEEIAYLKAKVARLERERGKAVRDAKEEPYEENTPSSKQNFKKDTPQEMRTRQGGAKEGHEGHGRAKVAADDADERMVAEAPAVCPDCGTPLVAVAPRERVLRDVPPPRFTTAHWDVGRGMCPRCHRTFEGEVPSAMPRVSSASQSARRWPGRA